uniref:S1 motif domain-containing protein n=1 Tax=Oryza rufipogon TaxID=4529 RepID=A0A0E0PQG4_ORYRU
MPPPSLLSLLPAASVSPRSRRAARRRPPTASRLPVRGARAASPLHASSSSSSGGGEGGGGDELHLLEKPFPSPSPADEDESESTEAAPALSTEEALAPFLKFFQGKSTEPDEDDAAAGGGGGGGGGYVEEDEEDKGEGSAGAGAGGRGVVYYDPKPGDLAVGVVVGGDGRTLDIDVGAGGEPALMLAKEAVPMTGEEFEYLACDVASPRKGRWESWSAAGRGKERRRAGGTERGEGELNVPIKVKIFEWNAGGLLTRIEGLRAFLPKPEMMTRPRNFTDLKNTVGQQIHVCITRIDEKANELIISEKEAWAMTYLREGTLLQGTVRKLFPYGAQITIGDTNRGGLLHVSNITRGQLTSVGDVLKVGEEVKAIKVFSEAEEMAQRYRDQISEKHQPAELDSSFDEVAPFDDEAVSYANWKWLRFSKSDKTNFNPRAESGL